MIDAVSDAFTAVQAWLFEQVVQPFLFAAGQMSLAEQAFDAVVAATEVWSQRCGVVEAPRYTMPMPRGCSVQAVTQ